jgi:signal transduction histidine kinase
MIIATTVLALVIGTAFLVLLSSVADLRGYESRARDSQEGLVGAYRLERLVMDLETGERGYLLTAQESFLRPWTSARAALPAQEAQLERLVTGREQSARVRRIVQAIDSYVRDYSVPVVAAARRNRDPERSIPVAEQGEKRVDAIRTEFDGFLAAEDELAGTRQQSTQAATTRAIGAVGVGLAGSIVMVLAVAGYLTSAIVRPIRRVAAMTGRLADGDLSARLPETGAGEIGALQRGFNVMAESLQDSRTELASSRARIVAAADHARRRIERDLHDGIQQQLVSLALQLRLAETSVPAQQADLRGQLGGVGEGLTRALADLREIARGIHPAILSEGGLEPALKALARRSAAPVELQIDTRERLPEAVEVAAYYVVSEALANSAKHAHASFSRVEACLRDGALHLSVRDDGVGGAAPAHGSGLIGLRDRVDALGGSLRVDSPPGHGTALVVELPLPASESTEVTHARAGGAPETAGAIAWSS